MQKIVLCLIAIILLTTSMVGAQDNYNDRAKKYIDQYATLAILEQRKNGIPAAITLGQGILETEAGTSELMTEANNHFGIKCKNGWQGETFTHTDDAPDECFKKYKCAEDSYRDHSEHLKRNPRYSPLFSIKQTDYAGWARCLKKCGYATNPQYAQKLIKIIEDFGLQDYTYSAFDTSSNTYAAHLVSYATPLVDTPEKQVAVKDTSPREPAITNNKTEAPRIIISHDTHTVKDGETVAMIAKIEGVEIKKIMEFNFLYPNEEPEAGSVLELQKPARQKPPVRIGAISAHKGNAIVSGDDNTTAQNGDYITVDKTKPAAKITPAPAPSVSPQPVAAPPPVAVAEASMPVQAATTPSAATNNPVPAKVRKAPRKPVTTLAGTDENPDPQKEQELASLKSELDKVVYADDSKLIAANIPPPAAVPVKPEPMVAAIAKSNKFYTVKKGDTAFSIAKRYNVTVSQLMKWNNMDAGAVKTGQTLQVKE